MEEKNIGRYRLIRKLGEGGQGCVWLAEHEGLHSLFAMKLAYGDRDALERKLLRRESERMRELEDRRIPYLVDFFEEEELSALVMEYVDGISLAEYLEQNAPLGEREAGELMIRLCDIVAYLHEARPPVLYRDIKPANFMISETGELRLLDFGTALTESGRSGNAVICGTPGYAAPEQLQGKSCHADADVYALAAVWSYMLTGQDPSKPPFHPLHGKECGRMVSRAGKKLLDLCLSDEPSERPQNAAVLTEKLRRLRPGTGIFLRQLETVLYRTTLWLLIIAASVTIFFRYNAQPLPQVETALGAVIFPVLAWGMIRERICPAGSFILARNLNIVITEKKGRKGELPQSSVKIP
ncbi:MAG: serine/threonine protein kinase [Lachnospiraceae bacterium]|nr:serine/threonine protein kinase [Lachnospiraceae bacterium]